MHFYSSFIFLFVFFDNIYNFLLISISLFIFKYYGVNLFTIIVIILNGLCNAVCCSAPLAVVVGSSSCVLRSSDLGGSWQALTSPSAGSTLTFRFHPVAAVSSSILYLGASNGAIYRSLDGGTSWSVDFGESHRTCGQDIPMKYVLLLFFEDFYRFFYCLLCYFEEHCDE